MREGIVWKENGEEWGEIVEIYRKNRSIDNIREEQNILEEQKKREDGRTRQKLRGCRMRKLSEKKKIQQKEAEELRDSKGTEKTEQQSRILSSNVKSKLIKTSCRNLFQNVCLI